MVEREFFIDNLLAHMHFIFVMIRWTGIAPWVFGLPFPCDLIVAGKKRLKKNPVVMLVSSLEVGMSSREDLTCRLGGPGGFFLIRVWIVPRG